MNNYNIVVTFWVNEDQKKLFNNLLKGKGTVKFLKDVPKENRYKLVENADILIAWNPVKELKNISEEKMSQIKFVQLLSAGYDQVNFEQFPSSCRIACNKGAYSEPMAEHIVGMILALYKNLLVQHQSMAKGEFDQVSENRSLKNSTCGIIGFGGIGKATAKLLKSFDTKIFAINTSGETDEEVDFIGKLKDIDYVLKNTDIIIISIPLNDATKNLITKRELELMKPDGMIINVARGAIINEKDLYNHLKNNKNFLAGIDAWWNEPFSKGSFELDFPFFELPNVLGSPHNSAVVPGSLQFGAERAIKNVLNFIDKKEITGLIKN